MHSEIYVDGEAKVLKEKIEEHGGHSSGWWEATGTNAQEGVEIFHRIQLTVVEERLYVFICTAAEEKRRSSAGLFKKLIEVVEFKS